jgi:hypothetical protein
MFFKEADLIAHQKPGVCNKADHNQTLEMFAPEPPKTRSVKSASQKRSTSSVSRSEEEVKLGKRKEPPQSFEKLKAQVTRPADFCHGDSSEELEKENTQVIENTIMKIRDSSTLRKELTVSKSYGKKSSSSSKAQ